MIRKNILYTIDKEFDFLKKKLISIHFIELTVLL
jgi:hypothetical protein